MPKKDLKDEMDALIFTVQHKTLYTSYIKITHQKVTTAEFMDKIVKAYAVLPANVRH